MKSEPKTFSIDDLGSSPRKTTHWDGVRNFQARKFMRDQMQRGDLAFFYHSNCEEPGIAGIVTVVKTGYPDHTAFDPRDKHYDAESDPKIRAGTWSTCDSSASCAADHAREAPETQQRRAPWPCFAKRGNDFRSRR